MPNQIQVTKFQGKNVFIYSFLHAQQCSKFPFLHYGFEYFKGNENIFYMIWHQKWFKIPLLMQ